MARPTYGGLALSKVKGIVRASNTITPKVKVKVKVMRSISLPIFWLRFEPASCLAHADPSQQVVSCRTQGHVQGYGLKPHPRTRLRRRSLRFRRSSPKRLSRHFLGLLLNQYLRQTCVQKVALPLTNLRSVPEPHRYASSQIYGQRNGCARLSLRETGSPSA